MNKGYISVTLTNINQIMQRGAFQKIINHSIMPMLLLNPEKTM